SDPPPITSPTKLSPPARHSFASPTTPTLTLALPATTSSSQTSLPPTAKSLSQTLQLAAETTPPPSTGSSSSPKSKAHKPWCCQAHLDTIRALASNPPAIPSPETSGDGTQRTTNG